MFIDKIVTAGINSKDNFLGNPIFCNQFRQDGSSSVLTRGDSSFDRVVISSERRARIPAKAVTFFFLRGRNDAVRKVKEEQRMTARMGGSLGTSPGSPIGDPRLNPRA